MKNNEEFPITLMVFLADWKEGDIRNIDCRDSKWVDTTDIKNLILQQRIYQ